MATQHHKKSSAANSDALLAQIAELESDIADLQMLYENTMEHGTSLENELMLQNQRMELLQNQMRKYLSPQLYQALLGGTADTSTTIHRRTRLTIYFSDMVGFSDLTDAYFFRSHSKPSSFSAQRKREVPLPHCLIRESKQNHQVAY